MPDRGLVAIVHGAVPQNAPPDDQDTLVQVEEVAGALNRLGYRPVPVPVTLDLAAMMRRLRQLGPVLAFNLVESLEGAGQHIYLPPSVLDGMGIPYTGCDTAALFQTSNKVLTKQRLREAGIATPDWFESPDGAGAGRFIVKSVWEDASIGLDAGSVVDGAAAAVNRMAEMRARLGGRWFAERFVDGREFNIALIEGAQGPANGPIVLPAAELRYIDFPPGMPRIADYASKWDKTSFAYVNTPIRLDLRAGDGPVVERMGAIALRCWDLFALKGYARVDFRLDGGGTPLVLEINPNPCLSPDSGFARVMEKAGMSFDKGIEMIVEAAIGRAQTGRAQARRAG